MTDTLQINYEGKPCYNIVFKNDFSNLAKSVKGIGKDYDYICIVSDTNVDKLYLAEVLNILKDINNNVCSFSFEAGEASKNLDTVGLLYEHLIRKKFTRNSLLVALGGGVVGDMTGFAASTFLRGVDFIQIPTTLLSQVDSSVGGKTGVDFKGYKNMVGAFYMPCLVYMNTSTLLTLDAENFSCGMGEVIKSALIADAGFYNWLKENHDKLIAKDMDSLRYAIFNCCKIKGHVVETDPKEKGIRSYLNFGHTIGHAIEKLCDFKMGHGQCVGLGMISAAYLSNKLGYIYMDDVQDIINTIRLYNMPTSISGLNPADVLSATKSDKKMAGSRIKFTIITSIGTADSYYDFTDEDLLFAIEKVLN